jgi:hypothetical protein
MGENAFVTQRRRVSISVNRTEASLGSRGFVFVGLKPHVGWAFGGFGRESGDGFVNFFETERLEKHVLHVITAIFYPVINKSHLR